MDGAAGIESVIHCERAGANGETDVGCYRQCSHQCLQCVSVLFSQFCTDTVFTPRQVQRRSCVKQHRANRAEPEVRHKSGREDLQNKMPRVEFFNSKHI